MFVERKKEGGRGEEEGKKRRTCYFQVWGIHPVSLYFMLLSHCHEPFGLTEKEKSFLGQPQQGAVACKL